MIHKLRHQKKKKAQRSFKRVPKGRNTKLQILKFLESLELVLLGKFIKQLI